MLYQTQNASLGVCYLIFRKNGVLSLTKNGTYSIVVLPVELEYTELPHRPQSAPLLTPQLTEHFSNNNQNCSYISKQSMIRKY